MSARRNRDTASQFRNSEDWIEPIKECPMNRKHCYVTQKWANRALREMWKTRDCTGLEPYSCPHCGYFHLGHNSEMDKLIRHDNSVKEMGE